MRSANRPSGGNLEPGTKQGFQQGFPAGGQIHAVAGIFVGILGFFTRAFVGLLEGVIDGEGKTRVHLATQSSKGSAEAGFKMLLGLFLVAREAFRRGGQFRRFGHKNSIEKLWVEFADGAPQPDIKEIGERGIADIIVVWRICADQNAMHVVPCACDVDLESVANLI